jgi:hypothetical protein
MAGEMEQQDQEPQEGQQEPDADPVDMGQQPPSWVQYGHESGQPQQPPPREEMRAPTHGPGSCWVPPWQRSPMAMSAPPMPSSSTVEAACRALEERYQDKRGWQATTTLVAAVAYVVLDLAGKLWGGDQPEQAAR